MSIVKLKLTIAYDGEAYSGWQWQTSGIGVQQKVEEALAKLFPSVERVHSSSRTDTGVHALGMVAHVEIPKAEFHTPIRRVALAVNAFLPPDIRILSASRAKADFHARFHAKGKEYRYQVWNHPVMNPLLRRQAWHVPRKLDLAKMREAAKLFVGEHDFRSFTANRRGELEDAVRTVRQCSIKRSGPLYTFVIRGDGFLYKMCRTIVGTLVQTGYGRFTVADVEAMLARKKREGVGMTAPAHGLVLWKVFY